MVPKSKSYFLVVVWVFFGGSKVPRKPKKLKAGGKAYLMS